MSGGGGAVAAATLDELVAQHGTDVYRLALALGGSQAVAEEVTGEVMLALARSAGLDGSDRRHLGRRLAVEGATRRRLTRLAPPSGGAPGPSFAADGHRELLPGETDWSERPTGELVADGAQAALQQALEGLPDDWRVVAVLRDQLGLTSAEVADVLDRPVAAVSALLHRARLALREAVTRHLVAVPALR